MFPRKSTVLWALGLFIACSVGCGILWALGLFGTHRDGTISPLALERVLAGQRAKVIEATDNAPQMNAGSLKSASLAANRMELLEGAGFLVFAWQARYQIDREVYPSGIPRDKDQGILYHPPIFWVRGGKPLAITYLEGQPDAFTAAINRFMAWQPRFDPGYDPGWKYENAIDGPARDQAVAEVLGNFHTGLQRLADNYAIPEYAKVTSQYARARNELFALASWSPELLSAAEREAHERRQLNARKRLTDYTPLMRDVIWKYSPETHWHTRADLDAADYFDDGDSIALCRAIEADDIDQMEKLIAAGVDVNRIGKAGMTALMWAMPDDRLKRFECLLRNGADPNVVIESDFETVRHPMLVDPANPLTVDFGDHGCGPGDSVMIVACRAPIEYLALALQYGGDANLRQPESNVVPLEIVQHLHDKDARVRLLLDHGADATPTVRSPGGGQQ